MKILAFFAHPDDETMLVGGTLALLAQLGAQVHYLSATRGEGGEAGEPPLCALEELGAVRAEELRCAVAALGGVSLDFLDYVDPRVGPDNALFAYAGDAARVAADLDAFLRAHPVDVLFTHGTNGEYGHPAHLLTHQAARLALQNHSGVLLYAGQSAYSTHPHPRLMNRDDPADFIIDTSAVLEQVTAAAQCHRTQHALFVRNASMEAGRPMTVPEVIRREESLHRLLPEGPLDDPLARLICASPAVRCVHLNA